MPFRICIDARKLDDFGIGTYIRNLVVALAELDSANEYSLLVPEAAIELVGTLPDNFRPVLESSPGYSLHEQISVSRRLFELRPDLYHATHYVLPSLLPCPAVVTIHDLIHVLYPQFLPNRLAYYYARFMIRRSLRLGRRIISVSRSTADDLERLFPGRAHKIEVIPNGVDPIYHQRLSGDEIQERLAPLGARKPYLLFVGNPKPHKNLERLLRAYAAAVQTEAFAADLMCVGDRGESAREMEGLCESLHIRDRVLLVGHIEREALPAVYQGATIFLYPSLYEGFGLPVVEAMASGTAVITSNVAALKELAEGCAELVEATSVEQITAAILRLVSEPERRQQLEQRGRERARQFSSSLCAQRTLRVYEQALAQ